MLALELSLSDYAEKLRSLAEESAKIDVGKFLTVSAVLIRNDLKKNMRAGVSPDGTPYLPLAYPRPNGKTSPLWDTGAIARSVGGGVGSITQMSGNSLIVGTNLESAALHQYGGTVVPVHAKWLTIPLTQKAKNAGGARNFSGKLTFTPLGRGKAALRETRQPRGKRKAPPGKIQFLLVKKVVIKPRPFVGFSPLVVSQIDSAYLNMLGASA